MKSLPSACPATGRGTSASNYDPDLLTDPLPLYSSKLSHPTFPPRSTDEGRLFNPQHFVDPESGPALLSSNLSLRF